MVTPRCSEPSDADRGKRAFYPEGGGLCADPLRPEGRHVSDGIEGRVAGGTLIREKSTKRKRGKLDKLEDGDMVLYDSLSLNTLSKSAFASNHPRLYLPGELCVGNVKKQSEARLFIELKAVTEEGPGWDGSLDP